MSAGTLLHAGNFPDELLRLLGFPKHTTAFTLTASVGNIVEAAITYHPVVDLGAVQAWMGIETRRFRLMEIAPDDGEPIPWREATWMDLAGTRAAKDVLYERHRQVCVEGWTPEHDDEHGTEDMAFAAACYVTADEGDAPPAIWPWDWNCWKPKDRRRNLVKAAALILAEIERIDRKAAAAAREGGAA